MRVSPDDDVYRVNAVWLGPRGLTFPWTARYLAYAVWLVTFLVVLAVKALTVGVGVPPVWEFVITTLFTYGVMSFVDHERPVRAVWRTFRSDLSAPRPTAPSRPIRTSPKVRVRERPQHDRRLTRADFTRPGRGQRRSKAAAAPDAAPSGTAHRTASSPPRVRAAAGSTAAATTAAGTAAAGTTAAGTTAAGTTAPGKAAARRQAAAAKAAQRREAATIRATARQQAGGRPAASAPRPAASAPRPTDAPGAPGTTPSSQEGR